MNKDKLVLKNLYKHFGSVVAVDHINLSVEQGQLFSLLGPSGCGKTTTMRMIAGLETPDDGSVIVDGKVLSGSSGNVLPEKRNMGMVFQSYAVWPHMTVWENISYGLKAKKMDSASMNRKIAETLELVGLGQYAKRYPTQLSGGQQQRVALARSLACEPSILLLDEPLSNLDAKLRESMRFEIRSLQQRLGITAIYVTHSQDEALAVSDQIIIMRDGKIMQQGSPEEVYNMPKNSFVADFIGLIDAFNVTICEKTSIGYLVKLANGKCLLASSTQTAWNQGDQATLLVRPEMIEVVKDENADETNTLKIRITKVSFAGSIVNYFFNINGIDHEYRIQTTPPIRSKEGDMATILLKPEHLIIVES